MANKKFSDFTSKTSPSDVSFVVGYDGSDNVRISIANMNSAYLPLAGGTMTGNLDVTDAAKIRLGTGNDMEIFHNGSQAYIESYTGEFNITQHANDGIMRFKCDDGTGGTSTYIQLDGSAEKISVSASNGMQFDDNTRIKIGSGTGGDLRIYHDGTDSSIVNTTGHLFITNESDDKDIIFTTDDGAGGLATYMKIDGAEEQVRFFKNTEHGDSISARFGDSGDLKIYHNGANSYIEDTGTGDFYLQTNGANIFLRNGTTGNSFISMNTGNDDVSLKYGGSEKLATTSTGVSVTGNANFADDGKAIFGSPGNDLEIYHDGSNSYIKDSGTGNLRISGTEVDILNPDSNEFKARFKTDGSVELYHDNSKKFETTSTGVSVTGNANFADDGKAIFGAGGDFEIYHDGSNSYISDTGTGNLYIQASERIRFTGINGEALLYLNENDNVELYYNNVKTLETTSTGVSVTGQVNISALNTAVTNASDTGTLGEIRFTADYIFVCVATDTWKRVAIATW